MAAAETTAFSNKSELESWLDLPLDQADSLLQALDPEVRAISTFSLRCDFVFFRREVQLDA